MRERDKRQRKSVSVSVRGRKGRKEDGKRDENKGPKRKRGNATSRKQ